MKKLVILIVLGVFPYIMFAQSCSQPCDKKSCDKTSCGPEGTKKEEAAVITAMRSDLQTVITKISKSSVAIDPKIKEMKIEKGASDDESLLFISQAATSIRYELLAKIEPSKLAASLKDYRPSATTTKQQMVANLKNEIQVLVTQVEKL